MCRAPEGVRHLCVAPAGAPSTGDEVTEDGAVHRELQGIGLLTHPEVMGEATKDICDKTRHGVLLFEYRAMDLSPRRTFMVRLKSRIFHRYFLIFL